MSERVIPITLFVDADDKITNEEVLKGIEHTLPGTTVVRANRNGIVTAVIDGVDMEGVR